MASMNMEELYLFELKKSLTRDPPTVDTLTAESNNTNTKPLVTHRIRIKRE